MPNPIDGAGALARQGFIPTPVGTLEEIQAMGLDPTKVACCQKEVRAGIRGCPLEAECRFNLKRYGGFKYKGPRYVGYYLETHEGNRKEDFVACYTFIRTLQARMDAGMVAKLQGKPHEIIRIVAQEGEKILTRIGVPDNEKDKSLTAGYHYETAEISVPKFPRPNENTALNYEQELALREHARQKFDEDFEDEAYMASLRRRAVQEPAPFNPGGPADAGAFEEEEPDAGEGADPPAAD